MPFWLKYYNLCLGGLCRPLVQGGGGGGLPWGCALKGAFPFNPACRYFAQVAPSPSAPLQNLNEAPLRGVAL